MQGKRKRYMHSAVVSTLFLTQIIIAILPLNKEITRLFYTVISIYLYTLLLYQFKEQKVKTKCCLCVYLCYVVGVVGLGIQCFSENSILRLLTGCILCMYIIMIQKVRRGKISIDYVVFMVCVLVQMIVYHPLIYILQVCIMCKYINPWFYQMAQQRRRNYKKIEEAHGIKRILFGRYGKLEMPIIKCRRGSDISEKK